MFMAFSMGTKIVLISVGGSKPSPARMQASHLDLVREAAAPARGDETNLEVARGRYPEGIAINGWVPTAVLLTQPPDARLWENPGRAHLGVTGLPWECTAAEARPHTRRA